MGAISPELLYRQLLDADEAGVRLEMVMGQPIWEMSPSPLHQMILRQLVRSIRQVPTEGSNCECFDLQDAYIVFPDGSVKRPDLSIFCKQPSTTQQALTVIPDAVVEVVSAGSEMKDLQIGPPFYLAQGVKDVVVYDPQTSMVFHHKRTGLQTFVSPVRVSLECGCTVDV
jgi:Uma2 family endonuclease